MQSQLNEEELKNSKLIQQIAKLEEQIAAMSLECKEKDEVDGPHFSFTALSFLI